MKLFLGFIKKEQPLTPLNFASAISILGSVRSYHGLLFCASHIFFNKYVFCLIVLLNKQTKILFKGARDFLGFWGFQ